MPKKAANHSNSSSSSSSSLAKEYTPSIFSRMFLRKNSLHDEEEHSETVFRAALDSLSWSAKVWFLLLLAGWLQSRFPKWNPWPDTVLDWDNCVQVAVAVYVAMAVSRTKHLIFLKRVASQKLGRVALLDQVIDLFIFMVASMHVLEILHIDLGNGLQSLFAAGGVGALALALASKDLAENIVGGFLMRAWDAIEPDEIVRLGDGTEGIVLKLGLVETHIQSFDNLVTRIPNSSITSQKVVNISRITKYQVKQVLRFKYSDLEKLPNLLPDIAHEIQTTCEQVIADGSKPLRCVLTNYEADHIQAEVNCHFTIQPYTAPAIMARQDVILAIARVMQRHKVEFALPSITYKTVPEEGIMAMPPTNNN